MYKQYQLARLRLVHSVVISDKYEKKCYETQVSSLMQATEFSVSGSFWHYSKDLVVG